MPRVDGETYFPNFEQTGYEELRDWTPAYYRDIKEADANLRFAGSTNDIMAESLERFCRNLFAKTMDAEELSRMEAFFYMTGNASKDIEERRRLLAIAMAGSGKISTSKIADMIRAYTGAESSFIFQNALHIYIHIGEDDRIGSSGTLMKEIGAKMPAHVAYVTNYSVEMAVIGRGMERIAPDRVIFSMKAPFWYAYVLNGDWVLDGSHLLDAGLRYSMRAAINSIYGFRTQGDILARQTVKTAVKEAESISEKMQFALFVHGAEKESAAVTARAGILTGNAEGIGDMMVTVSSPGYWFLDGSANLDGSKTLNSIYREEEIE